MLGLTFLELIIIGGIGTPELIVLLIFAIAAVLIFKFIRRILGKPRSDGAKPANESHRPHPTTPPILLPVQEAEIATTLQPEEKRMQAATEVVNVPAGVTITVRRSRTFEHTIDFNWHVSTGGNMEIGLKQIVSASVRREIERAQGRTYQQSETTEYQVELNGERANRYKLTWIDIWLTGVAEIRGAGRTGLLPFQFRERTELDVVPFDSQATHGKQA
jgi:hypothetical protein